MSQAGVAGGGGGGPTSIIINGDTGTGASGNTFTFTAVNNNAGMSTSFDASGSTINLNLSDANANLLLGKYNGTPAITGGFNTILGAFAGNISISGNGNFAAGIGCLNSLTSGSDNIIFGTNAGGKITTGSWNNGIGAACLHDLIDGSNNQCFGQASGLSYNGSESNNVCFASYGINGESNAIHIGNQGSGIQEQNVCYIAGIIGVSASSLTNPVSVVIDSTTGQLGVGSGSAISWQTISASQTLAPNNGYVCIAPGGALNLALPATSNLGDTIELIVDGATSYTITQAAGQSIQLGIIPTTPGVLGSLTSTAQGDSITLKCTIPNLGWMAFASIGNPIIV